MVDKRVRRRASMSVAALALLAGVPLVACV